MSEATFQVGQRVQDMRGGSVGVVILATPLTVRVRWANGDESVYNVPSQRWLRVVEYDLAQLRKG